MNITETLRKAARVFEALNANIPAEDLKEAYAAERRFREVACKFITRANEDQMPFVLHLMSVNMRKVLRLANCKADYAKVTEWVVA